MKKDMMQKFFICLMILSLLVKEGYAEVTITPADGVKKDGDKLNFYMDENNHSFKTKTAIFIVNGATDEPTISFADSSKRFSYSIEKEGDSYVLYSTQSFDYEQNQRIYRMNVLVDAESYFDIVTLNINNIDDEPPSLTSLQCTLDENTVYNLKNSPCSCILTDEDGWLSKTTFTISPETEAGLFDMGFKEIPDDFTYQADVFIYLKDDQQLDYETISFYMFNIIAKDSANHPTTPPEVLAIINVGDMRDTPPVWTKMIAFEQFEEQQEKTFTVSARDGDVGINKPISYKVNSQDDEEEKYVTIDEKKGIIHVDPINRDKNDILMYSFEIAAYVSDEIEWSTSQSISFYIIDIDNNPPLVEYIIDPNMEKIVFDETTEKSTNLTFEENSTGGLNISIFMEDIDTGENAQFNVELEDMKDTKISYTEAFMIVPNIGYKKGDFEITILDSTKLDFEDENWKDIKFNVLAKGIHDESKQDRMSVNIALEDVNDEIPIFAKDEYSVTILETAKKDDYITTVQATDRDAEDKILKHTFVGSTHTSKILRIHSGTGEIHVNSENAFDYDTINPVFVQVKATDAVGHYSTVPLTINLEDVNNKAPTISSGDPISVEENQQKGTKLISKISASDIDTTADLTVEIDWESSYALKNSRRLDMTDDTIRKQVNIMDEDISVEKENIFSEILPGHRVVDLGFVLKWAIGLQYRHSKICTGILYPSKEESKGLGLVKYIHFKCTFCEGEEIHATEDPNKPVFLINVGAVWGTLATGHSYGHLQEQLACMDIPPMSKRKFIEIENSLGDIWQDQYVKDMELAHEDEKRVAIVQNNIDPDGIPYITVILDGGWSKRSYGHNYNALSGVGVIIGLETGKILFVGVRNKYCVICSRAHNKKIQPKDHKCFRNWTDSSPAMKSDIIVEGFCLAEQMYGVRYKYFIADGDSSVHSKIIERVPYGREVRKSECMNHALKNYGKVLYGIKNDTKIKLPTRKSVTKEKIKELQKVAQLSIYNCDSAKDLREDLRNGPLHVYGHHVSCKNYYCNNIGKTQDSTLDEIKKSGCYNYIYGALDSLLGKADKLISNMTSNKAEVFMNILARFNDGKRLNLVSRGSFQRSCLLSQLRYNKGANCHTDPWKSATMSEPSEIT